MIQELSDYSPRACEVLVLALWQAARKGALTRLRNGVYVLPRHHDSAPDPFALSLKMRDPLITPARAHLLIAHWLGLLDKNRATEQRDEDGKRVCDALRGGQVRVKDSLRRARLSGLLVGVSLGRYIYHSADRGRIRRVHPRLSA